MTARLALNFVRMVSEVLILITFVASPLQASDTSYAAVVDWIAHDADTPTNGLAPGVYGNSRIADLARYIPPGYLAEFDFPELDLEIEQTRHYEPHVIYQAATARFAGQARIAANGNLEGYSAGQPFSRTDIDAARGAAAGYMIAWNHVHRWEYFGFSAPETTISFLRRQGTAGSAASAADGLLGGGVVDRQLSMAYRRIYLANLAPLAEQDYQFDSDGGQGVFFKEKIEIMAPYDVAGTTIILERPIDQSQGDLVNSYLPTERRVRRLSAKERADSWMGTNRTLDDFGGYAGLVMDNTWSYLGRKVIPYVANTKHEMAFTHGPLSVIPLDRWQLRTCYVVEANPRWDGHPYGRRVLFIDQETFSIALTLIFDRNDALYKVISATYQRGDDANAEPSMTTSRMRASIVINLADRTANVARVIKPTDYAAPEYSRVDRIFSVADLNSGR